MLVPASILLFCVISFRSRVKSSTSHGRIETRHSDGTVRLQGVENGDDDDDDDDHGGGGE